MFDGLLLSFQVKSVKPETEIYKLLCKMSGCDFNEIIYIDDREDLIAKARLLGLNCIRFDGLDGLVLELRKYNVFVENQKEVV